MKSAANIPYTNNKNFIFGDEQNERYFYRSAHTL